MARRKPSTDTYAHPSASRSNLPTEQTAPLMGGQDRHPVRHEPDRREIDDDPILAWDRQPATDGHAAHPLYVREKVHPGAFVKLLEGQGEQPTLFGDFNGLPSPDAAYEWYQHSANWSNRIIHGESARVMASLLARENLGGRVQMIYFDPPYGMGYKSNFQVATDNRETPESAKGRPHDTRTVRAFRDTYERGVHSYLDLTLEKLVLMRELLAETGSLFMQIGDENVHRAAVLLDEVFGAENRIASIPYVTSGSSSSKTLPSVADFLLWYAKDKSRITYHQLYEPLTRAETIDLMGFYAMVEMRNSNENRPLNVEEKEDPDGCLSDDARLYQLMPLLSPGTSTTGRSDIYHWDGQDWTCPEGEQWRVSVEGLGHLANLGRLGAANAESPLRWKRYEDEIPGRRMHNVWHKMAASDKRYVVQTADQVIGRCILMSTNPGDLVFDPTCGGATTALVAERWGRRWITCDTSPIAVSIARQRLATAIFDYWTLADSEDGARQEAEITDQDQALPPEGGWGEDPAEGFVCERVPRVSAKVLAYDENPDPIMLVDKPRKKRGVIRVASPLTVESEQPWATVVPLEGTGEDSVVASEDFSEAVKSALLGHRINGGRHSADITVHSLDPWPDTAFLLEWKAVYTVGAGAKELTAAVMVAAEDVTVPGEMVREAARQIRDGAERCDRLIVAAFAFGSDAPSKVGDIEVVRAQMNRDLMIRDLSPEVGHEAFVIVASPDVRIVDYPGDQVAVEIVGYDTYDPATGNAIAGGPDDVGCWMLDTDHDGESFFARRIHFPGAQKDSQIKKLLARLGRRADEVEAEALTAVRSAPFDPPERGRVAVKVITRTGMEMTSVVDVDGALA